MIVNLFNNSQSNLPCYKIIMGEKNQEKFSSSGESGNLNRMLPETQLETITKVVGDIKKKKFLLGLNLNLRLIFLLNKIHINTAFMF